MDGEDTAIDFLSVYDFLALGTFYWASLVGERNADLWVPRTIPHWDNLWSPGVNKKGGRSSYGTENLSLPKFHPNPSSQTSGGSRAIKPSVPARALARTEDKGRPSQPHSPAPSHPNRWGWRWGGGGSWLKVIPCSHLLGLAETGRKSLDFY